MGEPGGEGKGEKMNRIRRRKNEEGKNEKAKGRKKEGGSSRKKREKGGKKMREEEERYWIPIGAANWIRSTSNLDILFYSIPETSSWFLIKISTVRFSYIGVIFEDLKIGFSFK